MKAGPWYGAADTRERNKQLGRLRSLDSLVRRGLIDRERKQAHYQARLGATYTLTDKGRRKVEAIPGFASRGPA